MPRTFFHTAFIFLMNNAIFVIHSIIHSIVQQNYSFKEFIHSKKHANYSFKDFIHSKKIQNNSFKKFIHSRKSKIIHSKKIFIQVKNGLSPMASFGGRNGQNVTVLIFGAPFGPLGAPGMAETGRLASKTLPHSVPECNASISCTWAP